MYSTARLHIPLVYSTAYSTRVFDCTFYWCIRLHIPLVYSTAYFTRVFDCTFHSCIRLHNLLVYSTAHSTPVFDCTFHSYIRLHILLVTLKIYLLLKSITISSNALFSIHYHRVEQIRFKYSLFSFSQTF